MGVWSIAAKPNWKDLFPIETEILGFSQGYKKLSYYVMGAPVIHGIVDHKPFVELYHRKDMDELSPRMLRLMHDILEQPFKMTWLDRKNDFILTVDALSRAQTKPHTSLMSQIPAHPPPTSTTQVSHTLRLPCFHPTAEWISGDPSLTPLYKAAKNDDLYQQLCDTVEHSNVGSLDQFCFIFLKMIFITFSWVDIISDYVLVIVLVEGGGGFLGLGILNPRIEDP